MNKPMTARGADTDKYVTVEGNLVKLLCLDKGDDNKYDNFYIPQKNGTLLLYKEHIDGPVLSKEEAIINYPEEFI